MSKCIWQIVLSISQATLSHLARGHSNGGWKLPYYFIRTLEYSFGVYKATSPGSVTGSRRKVNSTAPNHFWMFVWTMVVYKNVGGQRHLVPLFPISTILKMAESRSQALVSQNFNFFKYGLFIYHRRANFMLIDIVLRTKVSK